MDTKKLRQKILDLAIRGKLVPQDPNDEPASVLLERIKAEKERLIKEGKIKRSKKTIKISDTSNLEKNPFEVPGNWVWCNITSVTIKITDGTHNSPINSPIGDYKYITAKNIKPSGITLNDITYVSKNVHNEIYARCNPEKGDILYIKDGATTGIVTINTLEEEFSLLSSVALIKPVKNVLNKYLLYYLQSPLCYNAVRETMKGVGITRITLKQIEKWRLPLPPLAEQQRIVAEIDKLLSMIDIIENNQNDLQATIKHTKGKILDLAIHGKLVSQDPNDEPASEMLKRINPKSEITCDNAHNKKLPKGWCICKLENIVTILDNLRKPISSNERNLRIVNRPKEDLYPYYGATGLVGMIDDYILDGKFLLLGEDGAPFLDKNANKAYVITGKCWVNNHAHILQPQCNFDYLMHYLNHIDFTNYVNGSTRLKLTQADMRSILVVLPPFTEQQRIVKKIEELFFYLNGIQKSLEV